MKKILNLLLTGQISDYSENVEKLQNALMPFAKLTVGQLSEETDKLVVSKHHYIHTFLVNNNLAAQINFANGLCRLQDSVFELHEDDLAIVALLSQGISKIVK